MRKCIFFVLLTVICLFSACSPPENKEKEGSGSIATIEESKQSEISRMQADLQAADDSEEVSDNNFGQESSIKTLSITPYYQDKDGYIIPAARKIIKQEGVARAAVNCLIDSSTNREELEYFGLYPVLPAGTEILGLNLKEGMAVIDFNNEILKYGSEKAEKNIITSLVYTLTEFKTIKDVKMLINGRDVEKLKYGTDASGILNRGNVLINNDRISLKEGFDKTDIYAFKTVNENFFYLLPMSVEFEGNGNKSLPGRIVELLGSQPADGFLYSEIPKDTKLIGYSISSNLLTLNFNAGLLNYGGTTREQGILDQIVHSMKQLSGVEWVRILIDGKRVDLTEGTDISKDIPVTSEINDMIDR
jgi:germination protein M